ncbi:tail completion protein gp17 [Sphingomonas humi]|uniref:DUF3168 domain-containing protein n=1 Tax=Sphingomonas humi TaxID=335630 RepID=A0ABP7S1H8_9SPHN
MGATLELQSAVVAAFDGSQQFAGVYHDVPARAEFPFAVITCSDERDWSCKGRRGREIELQIVLWDDQPSRLLELEDRLESAVQGVKTEVDWKMSTMVIMGKRRTRDPAGPSSCMLQYRARLLSNRGEEE